MVHETRELRELSTPDLILRLRDVEQDLINTRFGLATRQMNNTAHLADTKRQIARIKTILHEREEEA